MNTKTTAQELAERCSKELDRYLCCHLFTGSGVNNVTIQGLAEVIQKELTLESLLADKAMLDWLEEHTIEVCLSFNDSVCDATRKNIDAAMSKTD